MKFLVDAQLPFRLARFLADTGHETLHTSQMPDGNRSTDAQISELADHEYRVVVTKDADFRDSPLLFGSPRRLLVIATGNITNSALIALFQDNVDVVVEAFEQADFVELHSTQLVAHPRKRG